MLGMSTGKSRGGDFTVEVTPFFPGAEHALTNAVPKKTDAQGNPILAVLMIPGTLPGAETVDDMQRLFKNRGVRLELLFRPEEAWALAKKGGGKLTGVKAKLDAIQVTSQHRRGARDVDRSREVTESEAAREIGACRSRWGQSVDGRLTTGADRCPSG